MPDSLPTGMQHLGRTPYLAGHAVDCYRCDNGLTVIFVRDTSAPVFSYQTWYRVGARDDTTGITGIAHLFEHMMFKATSNHAEGEFMRRLEAAGAPDVNAWTWNDETVYLQSLPAGNIDLIAGLEADRMQHLDLTEDTFETERQVVINERAQRVENDPYGQLNERLWQLAFERHAYGRPVIGWRPDLDAISLEDCERFYRTFYSPSNAVLVVVGDVDSGELAETISRHYGSIPAREVVRPEVLAEPEQTAHRRDALELRTETELLMMGVKIPATRDPDHVPLLLLDRVLFGGRSSRLYRKLVDAGMAARANAFLPMFRDPSLYDISVVMRPGRSAAEAEEVILREFEDLAAQVVGEAELTAARNKLKAAFHGDFKEARGIADFIGIFEMAADGFQHGAKILEQVEATTPERLVDTARRLLTRARTTTVIGRPRPPSPKAMADAPAMAEGEGGPSPSPPIPADPNQESGPEDSPPSPGTSASQWRPGHRPFFMTGAPLPITTDGGGMIFTAAEPRPPLVRVNVVFRSGTVLDPPGKEGLGYLTAKMLMRGTARRSKDRLESDVDALGASLETFAGLERTVVGGESLAETWPDLCEIMREVIAEPTFPLEEIDKLKDETRARIVEMRNNDRALGTLFHESALFAGHPYGRRASGTTESIAAITRDDMVDFHRRWYGENIALAGAAGAFDGPAMEADLRRLLAAAGTAESMSTAYPAPSPLCGRRVLLVDKPERTQTYVRIGHFGTTVSNPDYPALDLANTAFGGGNFNATLFQEIREKRGWSYGVGSAFKVAQTPHTFSLGFSPAVKDTVPAINLALQLFERLVTGGVAAEDLEFARRFTLGTSAFDANTPDKRLRLAVEQRLLDYDRIHHLEAVRRLSGEQVHAAVGRHFQPNNLQVTVVCTAAELRAALENHEGFRSVEVVGYDTLI